MGKGEVNSGRADSNDSTNYLPKSTSEASKMLEAALLQIDGILSGSETNSKWKDPVKDLTRNLVGVIQNSPTPPPPPDARTVEILVQWLQPSCLLNYARMIAIQGSLPNVCAAANMPHLINSPFYNTPCSSIPSELAQHASKDLPCGHHVCSCCLPQRTRKPEPNGKNLGSNKRSVGSLDRRRRKLRNKISGEHRAKSQSDLACCNDQRSKPHYCSLQQFHCSGNPHTNSCSNNEERLRKLENERSALHIEISILSEQVDVQSSKIIELETALQEKKDYLRHMEESLQKEVLSRSALETQKLELLSSLSEMKLRQASLEHENMTLRNANPLTNGERFSRHAGHYSSLPRPPTTAKKGVAFVDEEKTGVINNLNHVKPIPTKHLSQLSVEEIGGWLSQLGLDAYTNELKRWGASGLKLLDSTTIQLEKELDIKNPLHRRKLLYAVESERCNGAGFLGSDKMNTLAVLHWLDDIGLPQHKEAFNNAKIDGRVLHRLTTEDLLTLNVTSQIHATSLRRGIQVLREINFSYDNLERRSIREYNRIDGMENVNNSHVTLWTNQRVMDWLRMVDLAEYAPNLCGSGVHGGMMVYEHRFTSELLATILNIPPAKTLLRRHLTTHFNQIVGREVVQQKREIENTLGFVPLTLTARLKVPKRTHFTLKRKKSKNEVDFGNLVCPIEGSPPGTPSTPSTSPGSPNLNSPTL